MTENWRPVAGFDGRYEVSDLGRVRSLARRCSIRNGTRTVPAKILTPQPHVFGYKTVLLQARDLGIGPRPFTIHTLVLEAFVGPRPEGAEGCHGPNGITDNTLGNLRWDTHAANMRDKVLQRTAASGEQHGQAKLTWAKVREIRAQRQDGASLRQLAQTFEVSKGTIGFITTGKTWRESDDACRQ
jgi:hypothetical protein